MGYADASLKLAWLISSFVAQFYKNKHGSISTQDILIYPMEGREVAQFTSHRYLLVLEGVSNMVDHEALRVFFPDKGNNSCLHRGEHSLSQLSPILIINYCSSLLTHPRLVVRASVPAGVEHVNPK
jgi:hypothetical protein